MAQQDRASRADIRMAFASRLAHVQDVREDLDERAGLWQ
jgi:hypothetical protein